MMRKSKTRSGTTLLEVAASSFIVGALMVPSMAVLQQGVEFMQRLELKTELHLQCVNIMEEQRFLATAAFTDDEQFGQLTTDTQSSLAFRIRRTTKRKYGGIPNKLMTLSVDVWHDIDRDMSRDDNELVVVLCTRLSNPKLAETE